MTLTKNEISKYLFKKLGVKKCDAKNLIEMFFEEICISLENNIQVKLSGFGNFILHNKKQRPGRNPKNGKTILITSRRVVTFRSGQKLKNQLKNQLLKNNNVKYTRQKIG
ncbi:Integration host factor subunit alpha [Candidatus Providencia siddallii]|uniref:Integration host factor subunit alpha n=1 Tax=Candidatus Providencia siddallii TaxID=1715285 RepID=A0A0M6W732_9GAMM|nr:Integration host factor subunit alpha [Candidatus Providencia siddallii]